MSVYRTYSVFFSVLQSGSAHYHCKMQAVGSMVLVKNPRDELYKHSRAQDADGTECTTSHILENQVIEISDCNLVSLLVYILETRPCGFGPGHSVIKLC